MASDITGLSSLFVRTTSFCADAKKLVIPCSSFLSRNRGLTKHFPLVTLVSLVLLCRSDDGGFSPSSSAPPHGSFSFPLFVTPASAAGNPYMYQLPFADGHRTRDVFEKKGFENRLSREENATETASTLDGASMTEDTLGGLRQRRSRLHKFREDLKSRKRTGEKEDAKLDATNKGGLIRRPKDRRQRGQRPVVPGASPSPRGQAVRADGRAIVRFRQVVGSILRITNRQWWNAAFRFALSALQILTMRLPLILYGGGLVAVVSSFGVASPLVVLYSALAGTLLLRYIVDAVVSLVVAGAVLLLAEVGPPPQKAASISGSTSSVLNASPTKETAGRDEIRSNAGNVEKTSVKEDTTVDTESEEMRQTFSGSG
ncbi:hypothetical protein CSUI_001663 [Cystoisospora suis]|uniref:Transmembrane protein n=1 Tax=Cystoisospora suis TaxID=483139 RepID=A0A2C6KKA5_9APIC|nr:hypothetical protein CSUI_001663 [Cystoisospora suis]